MMSFQATGLLKESRNRSPECFRQFDKGRDPQIILPALDCPCE